MAAFTWHPVAAATSLPYLSAHDAAQLRIARVYPGDGSVLSWMEAAEGTIALKQNIVNTAIGAMHQNALMIHWRRQNVSWDPECQAECPLSSGELNPTYMAQLDQWVTLSKQDGFYIIFDEWWSPMLAQSDGQWTGFNDSAFQQHWQNFYHAFAKHFAGNTTIAGFLCCEDVVENDTWPYTDSGSAAFNQLWSAKQTNVSMAVHQADSNLNYFAEVTIDWQGGSYTMGSRAMYPDAWIPLSDPDSTHVGYRAQWMPNQSIMNPKTNPYYPYDDGLVNGGANWINQTRLPFMTEFLPNLASNWVWNSTSFTWETNFLTRTYKSGIGVDFCNYDNDTSTAQEPCSLFDQNGNELQWGIVYANWAASLTTSTSDYSVTASPTTLILNLGLAGTSTITVSSMNGFTGTINLSQNGGTTCSLSAASVALTAATTSGLVTLNCAYATTGTNSVTVTGTNGSLTHTATVTFQVVDYTVAANPTSVSLNLTQTGTATITVAAVNDFTGIVALTQNGGTSCSLTTSIATLTATTTSATVTLSCSFTTSGTFPVVVTGTSGSLSHSATVTFNIGLPDFSVTSDPAFATVDAGTAVSSTITVRAIDGFTGTVRFSQNGGTSCSLSASSVSLTSTITSDSLALTCTYPTAGNNSVTVTGKSGSLSHVTSVTFQVVDFTVNVSSTSVNVNVDSPATVTTSVQAVNGFTGTVSLTSLASSPSGITCTLTPTSVTLGTSGSSTLSCISPTAGTFTVTVTGASGSLTHSATVMVTIRDFTVTASPTTLAILASSTATSTMTVAPINGFAGTVTLTSTVSPADLTCTLSPNSIVLGASQASTFSCSGSAGVYTITVTGSSSSITHTATVTVTVQDFTISASQTSISIAQSGSASSTVTINAVNGFSGVVSLTSTVSPTGLTCTLTPTSVTDSGTSTLNCTGSIPGAFNVIVAGTIGSLSHTTAITVTVTVVSQPDFTVAASSTSVSVLADAVGNFTITVTPVNGFTGNVSLTSTLSPTGLACTLTPSSIVLSTTQRSILSCSGPAGTYPVTVTGTSGSLTHFATATYTVTDFTISAGAVTPNPQILAGSIGASTITMTALNGFTGTVALSVSAATPGGLSCTLIPSSVVFGTTPQTSPMQCSATAAGDYTVTVKGTSGTLSHASASILFHMVDFTINARPPTISFAAGDSSTSDVALSGVNGFSGVVVLTSSASPSSLTCSLSPTNVTGSGTAVLTCSGSTTAMFGVTVAGTSGSLSHSVTVTVTVNSQPDFIISANPAGVTALTSDMGTSTITLVSLNGFTGTLTLTSSALPAGLTCSLGQTSLVLVGSNGSALSCTGPAGTYIVTVTGTSDSLSHSTSVIFTVQDFSLTAGPAKLTVPPGATGNSTITIDSVNGFNANVSLTSTVMPGFGLTCTLSQDIISGGSGSSTLSCNGSKGIYNVTVTGTIGSLTNSVVVAYHQAGRYLLTVATPSAGMLVTVDGQTWTTDASGQVSVWVDDGPHTVLVQSTQPSAWGFVTGTFASWADGNTSNPLAIQISNDTVLTATYRTSVQTSFYALAVGLGVFSFVTTVALLRRRERRGLPCDSEEESFNVP